MAIQAPDTVFTSDTTQINVTLTRSATNPAVLRKPLSITFYAEDYYEESDPKNISEVQDRPLVKRPVTFRPGETTKTIGLPVYAVPAGAADYRIVLNANDAIASMAMGSVNVYASPDRVPPTIVETRLTPQGLALTFSKPMDPATVQNVGNYQVINDATPGVVSWVPSRLNPDGRVLSYQQPTVALRAAVYDPATRTVTLIPTQPLGTGSYHVQRLGGPTTNLTDLEGNPYLQNSDSVPVGPNDWHLHGQ